MTSVHERLVLARAAAGYETATAAAEAMGVVAATYVHHENGTRGISRSGERYARFFRVSLDWLVSGKGEMRPRRTGLSLPFFGTVGAGSSVEPIADAEPVDMIDLPDPDSTIILQVRGESAYPRYQDGDYLLVDRAPALPETMLGRYCVIDLADGRRVVKRLGRVRGDFVLESQNAGLEIAPRIIGCYRVRGTLER